MLGDQQMKFSDKNILQARQMVETWDEHAKICNRNVIMFFYEFSRPFLSFEFMRRSLIACLALSLGCGPVGTLLVLKDELNWRCSKSCSLPGAAIGFMIAGLSLVSMSIGGFIAGILVALLSGFISRLTQQREDASFAAFYLISLAIGVLIISMYGSNIDIMHVLFGTILAIDNESLFLLYLLPH